MAKLPEGFVIDEQPTVGLPSGFVVDDPKMAEQQPEQPKRGFIESVGEAITGSERMTPEISGLREVTGAPELGGLPSFSIEGFKELYERGATPEALTTAAGLLATADPDRQAQIIKANYPGATFRADDKGNIIVGLESGEYVLNAPGFSASDAQRLAAQIGAFTPAGRAATIPGAVGAAGATETALQLGAVGAGAESVDPVEVAISAGLGGFGKGLEDIVSAISRYRRGFVPQEAREVIETAEEVGAPVMTTDVVAPETLAGKLARSTGEAVPFAGTGGQRAAQQEAREAAVEQITQGVTPMYDDIVRSLKEKTGTVRAAAGERLQQIGDQMEQVGRIEASRTTQAIDDVITDLSAAGRVPDEATLSTLRQYKDAIDQGQTFKLLDTLRSDFREAVKGERQVLPSRAQAASERIYKAMTDDLQAAIREKLGDQAAQRFRQAKGVYAREMETLKKSRLKSVLDKGDVTPESVKNVLFSQKPSEQRALYRSLTGEGRAAARVTILNDIVEKAGRRVGGLTPNSFATELGKRKEQIGIFFKGEERQQLKGMQRFLDATRRAQDAQVATPTGQSLMGVLGIGGAVTDLGATLSAGVTAGTLARVYESAPVRNALLRLASAPPRGDAYDIALREASEAVRTSLLALEGTVPGNTSGETRTQQDQ